MKPNNVTHHPFILATVSGKGGVGKSLASVNIADTLRKMGCRTALFDADPGMSNCATLLNEPVAATVMEWVRGQCGMEDLLLNSEGLTLVTGCDEPGISEQDLELLMEGMDQVLMALAPHFDIIIIDTPAGSGDLGLWALDRAQLGMVILVDEPTAISDVYRYCKYILNIDPTYPFSTIVNFADDEKNAADIHERFNAILKHFINRETGYLGFIPASDDIRKSVQRQKPVSRQIPESPIIREFEYIANRILHAAPDPDTSVGKRTITHD